MKAVLFLLTKEGEYLFKCDSFWSKSESPDDAKIYSNNDIDQVNSWLRNGIMPWNIYNDKTDMVINRYSDGILGYFTPDESKYDGNHRLKTGTTIEELGDPTYLWIIKLNPFSKWVIKEKDEKSYTPDGGSMCEFENYTEYHRDKILKDVLKDSGI